MIRKKQYSEHLDVLIALVTHLALTKYRSRTPAMLAKYLSLDENEVTHVLESFPGIFRKSISPAKSAESMGQHYFTVHMRYALRWTEKEADNDTEVTEPLDSEYLVNLLSFISSMANQERSASLITLTTWVTFAASALAATASIIAVILTAQ